MRANICDYSICSSLAVDCFDVRVNGFLPPTNTPRHYELCAEHSREYFPDGEGFLNAEQSARIAKELA